MRITVPILIITALVFAGCASTGTDESGVSEESDQTAEAGQTGNGTQNEKASDGAAASTEQPKTTGKTAESEKPKPPEPVYLPVRIERELPNGVIDSFVVKTYDESSLNLVSEETYLSEERLYGRVTIHREDDTIIRRTYDENGALAHVEKDYLEDSRIARTVRLDEKQRILSESTYEYDAKGRLVRWTVYDSEGELLSYTEYEYDGPNRIRAENYDRDGNIAEYREWEYEDGRVVTSTLRDAVDNAELEEIEYSYDADGFLMEKVRASPGYYRRTVYADNARGNLKTETHYGRANALLSTYTYSYKAFEPANDTGTGE